MPTCLVHDFVGEPERLMIRPGRSLRVTLRSIYKLFRILKSKYYKAYFFLNIKYLLQCQTIQQSVAATKWKSPRTCHRYVNSNEIESSLKKESERELEGEKTAVTCNLNPHPQCRRRAIGTGGSLASYSHTPVSRQEIEISIGQDEARGVHECCHGNVRNAHARKENRPSFAKTWATNRGGAPTQPALFLAHSSRGLR